jgi:3-oxo-4-pregnene-20-carboxyl-CoA dehydrogenase alpha subunit
VDFTPGETQQAIARVAASVLGPAGGTGARPPGAGRRPPGPGVPGDEVRQDRPAPRAQPREGTRDGETVPGAPGRDGQAAGFDAVTWKELGQAGLLSLALPDWLGGDGLGVLEITALLTEIGARAAPVPALATLALGVLPVTRWGDRAVQAALLAGVGAGDTVLTAGVREPSDPLPPGPATVVSRAGTVSGVKLGVPDAAAAAWLLVPASFAAGGTGVVIVDPAARGVTLTAGPGAASRECTVALDNAPLSYVLGAQLPDGGTGGVVVAGLYQAALAGACALADGALAGALALTTAHLRTRQQFGRPIATFQAAAQHIADVYIAARTLHLAAVSACWRLAAGRDAGPDLDVAVHWLTEQAPAALRTCHHLHGGLGMDVSYPLHRYSSLVRDLTRFAGGADYRLDRLAVSACGAAAG